MEESTRTLYAPYDDAEVEVGLLRRELTLGLRCK